MIPDEWFSVSVLFSGDGHEDLVATPEGAWRWKDEDEYAQRVGFVSTAQHESVEQARHRVIKMIETQSGPLSEGWTSWRREHDWPTPSLPQG